MSLKKLKNEVSKLKKEMDVDEEPTLQNFFKFLEKHYGRKAHYGEIHFPSYRVDDIEVQSDPVKFCRLSEEYYTKIHNVPNPVKDGEAGLKIRVAINWVWSKNNGCSTQALLQKTMNEDEEFNAIFDDAWNDIIEKGDFSKYNKLQNLYERM